MSEAVTSHLIMIKKDLLKPIPQGKMLKFSDSRFHFKYSNLSVKYYELPARTILQQNRKHYPQDHGSRSSKDNACVHSVTPHDGSTVAEGKNRRADSKQKKPFFCLRTLLIDAPASPKRSKASTVESTSFCTKWRSAQFLVASVAKVPICGFLSLRGRTCISLRQLRPLSIPHFRLEKADGLKLMTTETGYHPERSLI